MALMLLAMPALGADIEYGAWLAGDCTSCHRPGAERGIPRIAGMPADELAEAMHAFRDGERRNPTMQSVARSLGEAEIEALAAYFESLEPRQAGQTNGEAGGKP